MLGKYEVFQPILSLCSYPQYCVITQQIVYSLDTSNLRITLKNGKKKSVCVKGI